MPIAKGLLVSSGERRTYEILQKYPDMFKIFTKVRFFDVVDWDTPGISEKEHQYLAKTHFDFVVCDARDPFQPLFAIEFDGIGEDADSIDPYRKLKKKTKSKVCKSVGFPLLWLEFENIRDIDGDTMLNFIIENYVGMDIMFRPTLKLLMKYQSFVISGLIEDMSHQDGWVQITRKITFNTTRGLQYIIRSARVNLSDFSDFGSSVIHFTDDVAQYECLRALDAWVNAGEVTLIAGGT